MGKLCHRWGLVLAQGSDIHTNTVADAIDTSVRVSRRVSIIMVLAAFAIGFVLLELVLGPVSLLSVHDILASLVGEAGEVAQAIISQFRGAAVTRRLPR